MRPETFSRAMLALREAGVQQQGGAIDIADVDRLRSYAGVGRAGPCA